MIIDEVANMIENLSNKKSAIAIAVIFVVLTILSIFNLSMWHKISMINAQIQNIMDQVNEAYIANKKVFDVLNEIKTQQAQIQEQLKQQKELEEKHSTTVSYLKQTGFSVESDLSSNGLMLTADDMDKIINYWILHMHAQSEFKGKGQAFIEASKETGLNPIYILAHAAAESGFGKYALGDKHNYFGINCVDSNPSAGYSMGDSVEEGIIAGAKWIKANYYDNGYTTLGAMKRANYATDPNWPYNINNIMNQSLKAL